MKHYKLFLLACALVSVARVHGYCEDNPNYLATIINNSAYPVKFTTDTIKPGQTQIYGTGVRITNTPLTIRQDESGIITVIYTLVDTGNGLRITKNGVNLASDNDAFHGCDMYLDLYFNPDNSSGFRLRNGGPAGNIIVERSFLPDILY